MKERYSLGEYGGDIDRWLRNLGQELGSRGRDDLRMWLEARDLLGSSKTVLVSTSGLRRAGMTALLGSPPRVFNGQDIRALMKDVPRFTDLLAGSVGAEGEKGLLEQVFEEVNYLGLYMPNEPYKNHVWVQGGVIRPGVLHPLSMAELKVFNLDLIFELAGVPPAERPIVVGIDTVNALINMTPEEARYYGLPSWVRRIFDERPWLFLDKVVGLRGDLDSRGGVAESVWGDVLEFLQGIGQVRSVGDRTIAVVNGIIVSRGWKIISGWLYQRFSAMRRHDIPNNFRIPGGVDTRIKEDGSAPFSHDGGRSLVNGERFEYPGLGLIRDAFDNHKGKLAEVMMGVRGLPGREMGLIMQSLGCSINWWDYMDVIVNNPKMWMNHAV